MMKPFLKKESSRSRTSRTRTREFWSKGSGSLAKRNVAALETEKEVAEVMNKDGMKGGE